jgi:hypothetical protein
MMCTCLKNTNRYSLAHTNQPYYVDSLIKIFIAAVLRAAWSFMNASSLLNLPLGKGALKYQKAEQNVSNMMGS